MQFLEKENTRLGLEMKDLLYELNSQKEHHDMMHDKVAQLESSLEQGKVFPFLILNACFPCIFLVIIYLLLPF